MTIRERLANITERLSNAASNYLPHAVLLTIFGVLALIGFSIVKGRISADAERAQRNSIIEFKQSNFRTQYPNADGILQEYLDDLGQSVLRENETLSLQVVSTRPQDGYWSTAIGTKQYFITSKEVAATSRQRELERSFRVRAPAPSANDIAKKIIDEAGIGANAKFVVKVGVTEPYAQYVKWTGVVELRRDKPVELTNLRQ